MGYSGHQIAAGDFNDDGIQDVVYGSYGEGLKGISPQSGNVYVQYGDKIHVSMNKELRDMQVLTGENLKQSRFGWALQVLDFNLDGVDDLVVGAPLASFQNDEVPVPFDSAPDYRCYGKVYVYFGSTKTGLNTSNYISFKTTRQFSGLGSVLNKGDIDLDSHADLLIGAPYSPINVTSPLTGTVYAIKSAAHTYVGDKSEFDVSQAAYSEINGSTAYDLFGTSMSVDTNRLYVGAPGYRNSQARIKGEKGTVGCVYGYNLPLKRTFAPENIPILPVLQLVGEHHLGEFGYSMAQQFDHDYLVVGAPASTLNTSVKQGGVVYVVHNISAIYGVLCCSNVKIQTVGGAKPFERFGQRVQWIGLDADDSEDLVISAPLHSTNLNDFEKRELGAVSIYKNFRGSYSKSVFTSIDATTTFVGGYRGGRFGLSVLLLRNTTNSTFLYVSSPNASEGDFTMNGLIEVFVDV